MTGRQRIEAAAVAAGYNDQPDIDHGGWAQADHVRRYRKGSRRVTVAYDLHGRVTAIWAIHEGGTFSHRGAGWSGKADWVIDYLKGEQWRSRTSIPTT